MSADAVLLALGGLIQGVMLVAVVGLGWSAWHLGWPEEGVPLVDGPPEAVPQWPATLGASTSAPSAHVADAIREDTGDPYRWRPACRCGWRGVWAYASEPAALGVADDHVWQAGV